MKTIGSELKSQQKQINKLKNKEQKLLGQIDYLLSHIDSLERCLKLETQTGQQYRDFFNTHDDYCNWMRDHNLQFKAFKASPFYIEPTPPKICG